MIHDFVIFAQGRLDEAIARETKSIADSGAKDFTDYRARCAAIREKTELHKKLKEWAAEYERGVDYEIGEL